MITGSIDTDLIETKDVRYTRLDHALANFLAQRSDCSDTRQQNTFKSVVRELSAALAKGHSCIHVDSDEQQIVEASGLVTTLLLPTADQAVKNTPLILEDSRLYLQRYWYYETQLAIRLRYKVDHPPEIDVDLDAMLDRYFPRTHDEIDWQREAAKNVANQSFSIVTGGPGTGKTTTILKILAILQEIQLMNMNDGESRPLKIALAAPTGKAAMRLQESLGKGKLEQGENDELALSCSDEIKTTIPDEVSTIHRLLGAKPASAYFRHHADHPLVHDLVVIDEASMVDLALMSKLVDALKPEARLILLGDKNQLASVESGAILSDLSTSLADNTSELKKSWRFVPEIKELATAINQQDKETSWGLLNSTEHQAISLITDSLFAHIMQASQPFFDAVDAFINNHYSAEGISTVFATYNRFQVLCSNRRGKRGVEGINQHVERMLQHQGVNTSQSWYNGRPIIITQNDPGTQLFNGDIGICLSEKDSTTQDEESYVYFLQADGSIKKLLPAHLSRHDTAYALTIHKSQGSEFEHVLMVLPDRPNPVLSKELVYTAVTRAKKTVEVASRQEIFDYALSHQVQRNSGLKNKLLNNPNNKAATA